MERPKITPWWLRFLRWATEPGQPGTDAAAGGVSGGDAAPAPATSPPPVVATDRCSECGSTDPERHHPVCGVPRLRP